MHVTLTSQADAPLPDTLKSVPSIETSLTIGTTTRCLLAPVPASAVAVHAWPSTLPRDDGHVLVFCVHRWATWDRCVPGCSSAGDAVDCCCLLSTDGLSASAALGRLSSCDTDDESSTGGPPAQATDCGKL